MRFDVIRLRVIVLGVLMGGAGVLSYFMVDDPAHGGERAKVQDQRYTMEQLSAALIQEKRARRKADPAPPKFDHPDEFQNYHWAIRTRASEDAPQYRPNHKIRALVRAKSDPKYMLKRAARPGAITWKERGPANVPGRTRGLVALPSDPSGDTWIAGAVGGGIWKTTDGGDTWTNTTADLPSLAISWIECSRQFPQVLYAATGEANGAGRGIIGSGVFKSTDYGESWQQLKSTADDRAFTFINRVVVSPEDPDLVLVCTSQGEWERTDRSEIYRSEDGGTTWQRVHASSRWIFQVIANPLNFNTLYAAVWGRGVIKSLDGGRTWFDVSNGFNNVLGRVELAVSAEDTSRLYASVRGNHALNAPQSPGADLYVSFDAGSTWSWVDQDFEGERVDFLGGQGDYDNTIAVNPFDPDEAYYGGVSLWKTVVENDVEMTNAVSIDLFPVKGNESQWDFVNFGGPYAQGRLETAPKLISDEMVDIEIRTGPGLRQMAYRFTVNKRGSGVPDSGYFYLDYVEVPFEVWDTDNNRQLMVSFRDQQENGVFDLRTLNTDAGDEENHSREYIFIHGVDYSEVAHPEIARDGAPGQGHTYRQLYFFWPVLRDRYSWTPEAADTVIIDQNIQPLWKTSGTLQPVSDAYSDYVRLNPAYGPGSGFYFHPDHHNLIMLPVDSTSGTFRILNANDGGVYISNTDEAPGTKDGDWENAGHGYNTGQFYSATRKPGADRYIGGLQDNGTWLSPGDVSPDASTYYESVLGGDGFDVWWHYSDPDKILISIYNNRFYRSENGGETWWRSNSGIGGSNPFFSKLASSMSAPDEVYTVGSSGVYYSDNFGADWSLTPLTSSWSFSNFMDIKVSRANSDIVWAGSGMDANHFVHVSTDRGRSFAAVGSYRGAELGILSGMATHPEEDSTAYVLFSFAGGPKIVRTTDLGRTWEDISGFGSGTQSASGFPDVAVYALLVLPDDPNTLWAGTEIGIFESVDNGASWTFLESGLGAAAVWDMQWVDGQVVIATHGRGIFTAEIQDAAEPLEPPVLHNAGVSFAGHLLLDTYVPQLYDSMVVLANGVAVGNVYPAQVADSLFKVPYEFAGDSVALRLKGYFGDRTALSDMLKIRGFEPGAVLSSYVQDFNGYGAGDDVDDFIGNGMQVAQPVGFGQAAVHSDHPYVNAAPGSKDGFNYVFQLIHPILVAGEDAVISYNDIALVERAVPGAAFNTPGFKDYVVVEATRDGLHWTALGSGYDASLFDSWNDAYDSQIDGNAGLFERREIDLSRHLEAGDTVFIRFRLYANDNVNGWGWAMDDLRVQDVITATGDPVDRQTFRAFLYPNPASKSMSIEIVMHERAQVDISILDMRGLVVDQVLWALLEPGLHRLRTDVGRLPKGLYIVRFSAGSSMLTEKLVIR